MPLNRAISGMRQTIAQSWENILRPLPSHSIVDRIRTHIELPWPLDGTLGCYRNSLKNSRLPPRRKDADASEFGQVNNAAFAVVEFHGESKRGKRFCLNYLHTFKHSSFHMGWSTPWVDPVYCRAWES